MAGKFLDDTGLSHFWGKIKGKTIPYGYCETGTSTVAKTVTVSPAITSLEEGLVISVKFKNSNTASNPTLNVNSLGAKRIYRYGTTAPSTSGASSWNAGNAFTFIYDGSAWQMAGWMNSTYSSMTVAEYEAGTATTARTITPARLKGAIEYWATGEANVQSDWNQTDDTADDFIKNKPTIPDEQIFIATYGTTSYTDLLSEYNAGKIIFCKRNNLCVPLTHYSSDTFYFKFIENLSEAKQMYVSTSNVWNAGSFTLVTTSRTINGKNLGNNITLTASDVGALPDTATTSDLYNDSGYITAIDLQDTCQASTFILIVSGSTAVMYQGNSVVSYITFASSFVSAYPRIYVNVLNGASSLAQAEARVFEVVYADNTTAKVRLASVDNGTVYTIELQDTGNGLVGTFSSQTIPTGGITTETDPTVPAWAKASTKPTYTASEIAFQTQGSNYIDQAQDVGQALDMMDDSVGNAFANLSFEADEIGLSSASFQQTIYENDINVEEALLTTDQVISTLTASDVGALSTSGGQLTGDLTLYVASGNSPAIIFQRGTLTDNYNDWKIYDKSGFLYFAQRGNGSSAFGDVGYINTSGVAYFHVPWSYVDSKPTFATVATSGSYNDLSDKPTSLPTVTSSDNGKVLRVVNGAWSAVALPSASGVSF